MNNLEPVGWYAGTWYKNSLLIGFSGGVSGRTNVIAVAVNTLLYGTVVPANQVWVISSVEAWDGTNPIATSVAVGIFDGAFTVGLGNTGALAAGFSFIESKNSHILIPGWRLFAYFVGNVIGDNLFLQWIGHRFDLII